MDLLFLHHIFIMLIGISSPQPFCIPDYSICVFDPIRTIGIHCVPYINAWFLLLCFLWISNEIGVIFGLCIFSYFYRIFEINQHKYTTNSTFICTFNVFRSNHFICIFQNFLEPGKGACPPPRPSPRSGAIRSLA